MYLNCEVKTSVSSDSIENIEIGRDIYQQGIDKITPEISSSLKELIQSLRLKVTAYKTEFEQAVNNYMVENSVLSKMAGTLSDKPSAQSKLDLKYKEYHNQNESTQKLIKTMNKGHDLLLKMREELTGQKITTKFIISVEGKTYEVDESVLKPHLILSTFGAGTETNPFSLAYEIDKKLLEAKGVLKEENEISTTEIWQQIYALKRPYLDNKSSITGREYPNIFFDSKDAEIYELFTQQKQQILDLATYTKLRTSMGGGGGYASPFFKIGDIGLTQVKYFNIKKKNSKIAVNFTRFSLLRDRFRQLEKIFLMENETQIIMALKNFFTEKESNISDDISKEVNRIAQEKILSLLSS